MIKKGESLVNQDEAGNVPLKKERGRPREGSEEKSAGKQKVGKFSSKRGNSSLERGRLGMVRGSWSCR